MKTKLLLISLIFFAQQVAFCQIKGKVLDSKTKEKIPYVHIQVENEDVGVNSDEKGAFEFENLKMEKMLVFSAIGYETIKLSSAYVKEVVELNPQTEQLPKIANSPKKESKKLKVGEFKKSKKELKFVSIDFNFIQARYFAFKEQYKATPFLQKIAFPTLSYVSNAKFNVRLYGANEKGEPAALLHNENIIVKAKEGKAFTEIDVSDLNIRIPENGFFVAVQKLFIESNKYEFPFYEKGLKKKHEGFSYEPFFGNLSNHPIKDSWVLEEGNWHNKFVNPERANRRYDAPYFLLAIQLTLTN